MLVNISKTNNYVILLSAKNWSLLTNSWIFFKK
jgi:hypothetical protein